MKVGLIFGGGVGGCFVCLFFKKLVIIIIDAVVIDEAQFGLLEQCAWIKELMKLALVICRTSQKKFYCLKMADVSV